MSRFLAAFVLVVYGYSIHRGSDDDLNLKSRSVKYCSHAFRRGNYCPILLALNRDVGFLFLSLVFKFFSLYQI